MIADFDGQVYDKIGSVPRYSHVSVIFIHAQTCRLMSGRTIPASMYKSSTCVGFRHPVIARLYLSSPVLLF